MRRDEDAELRCAVDLAPVLISKGRTIYCSKRCRHVARRWRKQEARRERAAAVVW